MRDERKRKYEAYLRDLADRMRLRDWEVSVDEDGTPDGNRATIGVRGNDTEAIVSFSEAFLDDPPEARRQTCVHELLHLHLWGMDDHGRDELDERALETYYRLRERAVEQLARVLAPHLPLPPG